MQHSFARMGICAFKAPQFVAIKTLKFPDELQQIFFHIILVMGNSCKN